MLKQSTSFSTLTSPSLADKEPEEQELELPMLEARKRNPSLFSEDDLPSPSSISAERRRKEPVRLSRFASAFKGHCTEKVVAMTQFHTHLSVSES